MCVGGRQEIRALPCRKIAKKADKQRLFQDIA